ncbi:MAG TPA: hypothetical protein VIU13_04220 [Chryseolinea sp.]
MIGTSYLLYLGIIRVIVEDTYPTAGLGHISTIEGVTCISDDIDYGNYPIKDGKISVSQEPGFGMKIVKR